MGKRVSVKVEKGGGAKLYPTTKIVLRRCPGTPIYPQSIKFEEKCKYLKGFVFNCSGGSNTEEYSKSMKETAEYIGCKFI